MPRPIDVLALPPLLHSFGVFEIFGRGCRSGNSMWSATSCACAISDLLSSRASAERAAAFEEISIGKPKAPLSSVDSSLHSRGFQSLRPSRSAARSRFKSGTPQTYAPLTSHETPRLLPEGERRNSRISGMLIRFLLECSKEHIMNSSKIQYFAKHGNVHERAIFGDRKGNARNFLQRDASRRVDKSTHLAVP